VATFNAVHNLINKAVLHIFGLESGFIIVVSLYIHKNKLPAFRSCCNTNPLKTAKLLKSAAPSYRGVIMIILKSHIRYILLKAAALFKLVNIMAAISFYFHYIVVYMKVYYRSNTTSHSLA